MEGEQLPSIFDSKINATESHCLLMLFLLMTCLYNSIDYKWYCIITVILLLDSTYHKKFRCFLQTMVSFMDNFGNWFLFLHPDSYLSVSKFWYILVGTHPWHSALIFLSIWYNGNWFLIVDVSSQVKMCVTSRFRSLFTSPLSAQIYQYPCICFLFQSIFIVT